MVVIADICISMSSLSLCQLPPHSSMSSDEDEGTSRQREFQTSFEEDTTKSPQQTRLGASTTPGVLSQIPGKAGDDSNMMDISSPYNDCEYSPSLVIRHLGDCFFFYLFSSIVVHSDEHTDAYIHSALRVLWQRCFVCHQEPCTTLVHRNLFSCCDYIEQQLHML